MVQGERGGNGVAVEQPAGHPGVLAGDQIGGGQSLKRPQRDVPQVSDRGGDQVQAGGQRRGLDRMTCQQVGLGPRFGALGAILAASEPAVMAWRSLLSFPIG